MILLITNNYYDSILKSVSKNKFLVKESAGDLRTITSLLDEKSFKNYTHIFDDEYKYIIVDSSAINSIDLLYEIAEVLKGKIIFINNDKFELQDLYLANIFHILNINDQEFDLKLLELSLKEYSEEDKIKMMMDEVDKTKSKVVVLNNRIKDMKFFRKLTKKNELDILQMPVDKYMLVQDLLSNNGGKFYTFGQIRIAIVLNDLHVKVDYYDDRDRTSALEHEKPLEYTVLNKGKHIKNLKKMIKQELIKK